MPFVMERGARHYPHYVNTALLLFAWATLAGCSAASSTTDLAVSGTASEDEAPVSTSTDTASTPSPEVMPSLEAEPTVIPTPSLEAPPTPVLAVELPDLGPAPDFNNDVWLNSDGPLNLAALRGKAVLVEFWTFG